MCYGIYKFDDNYRNPFISPVPREWVTAGSRFHKTCRTGYNVCSKALDLIAHFFCSEIPGPGLIVVYTDVRCMAQYKSFRFFRIHHPKAIRYIFSPARGNTMRKTGTISKSGSVCCESGEDI